MISATGVSDTFTTPSIYLLTLVIEKWVVKIILTLIEDKYNEEIKFVLYYQIIFVQLKVLLKCKLFHQCKLIGTFLAWHRWSNEYNYAGSMKWAISKSFVKTGNTVLYLRIKVTWNLHYFLLV